MMTTPIPHRDVSSARAGADLRTRRILLFGVLLPFIIAAGVSVGSVGRDGRAAFAADLVGAANRTAVDIEARLAELAAAPGAVTGTRRAEAIAAALDAAGTSRLETVYHDASSGYAALPAFRRTAAAAATAADTLPTVLPEADVLELESLDRAFATRLGGRFAGIAPVKDTDRWDLRGAIVVRSRLPDPPLFPAAFMALAGLAFGLTAAAVFVFSRRPGRARALPVFVPALALAVALIAADTPDFPLWPGRHGFHALVAFASWAAIGGIGLSLVPLARRSLALGQAMRAWAFLGPSFLHLLIFSIGPILFAFWLSFHQWNLLEPARPFVGLANYRELAADADFWRAVRNTAVYVLFVPIGMVVALALALLVNRRIPGVRVLRTALFLPYITSFVAISLVWRWMFQPDVGLLNGFLALFGVPPQPWLSSPGSALPSLMLMSIWMYAGYMMVIFLAGLQNIPETLYESARIDGAGPWQRFRYITLPLLRPTTLFILVTMVIFMFQVFTAVYVMTEGGPLHATDVVVYHIYRTAWEYLRMGYASAMAWVLFAIVFVITLVQFRWLGGRPAQ